MAQSEIDIRLRISDHAEANRRIAALREEVEAAGGSVEEFGAAQDDAGDKSQDMSQKMESAGKDMSKWVSGPLAAVTAALGGIATATVNAGDDIDDTAMVVGMSTDAWQELEYAMGQVGLESSDAERVLGRMNQRMVDGADDTTKYGGAWADLGVEVRDSSGELRESEDVFMDTVQAISELESAADRSGAAAELFGTRMGRRMVPMLNEGADGIQALRDRAHELGIVIDEDTIAAADRLDTQWGEVTAQMQNLTYEIGSEVVPVISDTLIPMIQDDAIPALQGFAEMAGEAVAWWADLPTPIQNTSLAIGGVLTVAGPAAIGVSKFTTALRGINRIGGTVGLALAGVATAAGIVASQKAEAAEATEELTQAMIDAESANSAYTDSVIIRQLEDGQAIDNARDLGLTTLDLVDIVTGRADVEREVSGALREVNEQDDERSSNLGRQMDAANDLTPVLEGLQDQYHDSAEAYLGVEMANRDLRDEFEMITDHGFAPMVAAAGSLEEGLENLPPHLRPVIEDTDEFGNELGEAGENMDGLAEASMDFPDVLETIVGAMEAFHDPAGAYNQALEEAQDAARESAEAEHEHALAKDATSDAHAEAASAVEQFVDDTEASFGRYIDILEEQQSEQENWQENLDILAERAGMDIVEHFAELGPDMAGLAQAAVDSSDAELERLQDVLPVTTDNAAEDAKDAFDGPIHDLATIAGTAGDATVEELAEKLQAGEHRVRSIARQYGIELAGGLNPVLQGIGSPTISVGSGGQSSAGVTRADGGINLHSGIPMAPADADIYPPGTVVQMAEPSTGGEAYIPLDPTGPGSKQRSIDIWHQTGQMLGVDHHDAMTFDDGGFRAVDDIPSPPDTSDLGTQLGYTAGETLDHTFEEAKAWLEENLAPQLGSGIGWQAMWAALSDAFPDAALHSDYRPGAITATGNPSYHGMGRAIDVSPWGSIAQWIRDNYMAETREMIFSPFNNRQIHNGRNHMYTGITRAQHWDHVHWAMQDGGIALKSPDGTPSIIGEGAQDEAVVPLPDGWRSSGLGATNVTVERGAVTITAPTGDAAADWLRAQERTIGQVVADQVREQAARS